jgi:hypothetical protein
MLACRPLPLAGRTSPPAMPAARVLATDSSTHRRHGRPGAPAPRHLWERRRRNLLGARRASADARDPGRAPASSEHDERAGAVEVGAAPASSGAQRRAGAVLDGADVVWGGAVLVLGGGGWAWSWPVAGRRVRSSSWLAARTWPTTEVTSGGHGRCGKVGGQREWGDFPFYFFRFFS